MTGQPFDLNTQHVQMQPSGDARLLGFPEVFEMTDIDGVLAGAARLESTSPWSERHLAGDELLYLVSGSVSIVLEDHQTTALLHPSEAFLVPRAIWHHIEVHTPSLLLFFTPGDSEGERRLR
ncbi:MAG: hypothetical protein GEU75_16055 [Dehalococcoidia bacterium]|nr:hypothetical protein [Dehalococcoidia bacterium]